MLGTAKIGTPLKFSCASLASPTCSSESISRRLVRSIQSGIQLGPGVRLQVVKVLLRISARFSSKKSICSALPWAPLDKNW